MTRHIRPLIDRIGELENLGGSVAGEGKAVQRGRGMNIDQGGGAGGDRAAGREEQGGQGEKKAVQRGGESHVKGQGGDGG